MTSATACLKRRGEIAPLMPMRSPRGDKRRMKPDGAKCECAADACILAHGLLSKRIARAALNRAKT
jgi:hypothetical protein